MKKLIKRLLYLNVTLLIVLSFGLVVHAWTPPKLKNAYVEPEVQFRSVWVCTVSNMDIKKQVGTDEAAIELWKKSYLEILDNSVKNGMNAIIFQVSPCNDAFYPSKYRPWSEYLVGLGQNPGWDPVEWMIEVTHEAGLEYHAWFNPYRTSTSALSYSITQEDQATGSHYIYDYNEEEIYNYKQEYFANIKKTCEKYENVVDNPIFTTGSELEHSVVMGSEGKFVLNPAADSTFENLENTIREFITNYDADGIHFDDYFYPDDKSYKGSNTEFKKYTFSSEPDIDYDDYMSYKNAGGELSIDNWRRDNVNRLIKGLSDIIRENNKTDDYKCAFGISPAARWAPSIESCPAGSTRGAEGGMIASCNDYYSYSDLFADTKKWAVEGWLDYILPQVYTYLGDTPTGYPDGNYPIITKWWSETLKDKPCKLYIGTALYQINAWNSAKHATTDEFYYEQMYNQDKGFRVDGYVMFRYASMLDALGSKSMTKVLNKVWKMSALTPTYEGYVYDSVDSAATIKELKKDTAGNYVIEFEQVSDAKAYGVLADGVCVARVLSSQKSITFAKEEGKTYQFVTYGYDNQMHEDKQIVDFTKVKENTLPTIELKTVIDSEYLTGTEITLEYVITDVENDQIIYSIYAYADGRENILANEQTVVDGVIQATYRCNFIEQDECYLVLKINDGFGVVEHTTSCFKVVKEFTHVHNFVEGKCECGETDPNYVPPHVHEFVDGKCECGETDPNYVPSVDHIEPVDPGKKKCGKKNLELLVACISAAATLGIVFRKRD